MTTVSLRGFTIIELMMFVAISGALFASLMIGVNTNITQQRYRGSVVSYGSLLQSQYSEVLNPRNDRTGELKCASDTASPRGASGCVILGRAIWLTGNGTEYRTASVIGTDLPFQNFSGDLDALVKYKPVLSDSLGVSSGTFDWDINLVTTQKQPSMASFLILRSPTSGLIKVFASDSPLPRDLSNAITESTATVPVKNCVRGQTGLLPIASVEINPQVAGPNGVVLKENDSVCE